MGKFVEGGVPLGYVADRKDRTLWLDENKAEIIRRMFALCIDGLSTRQISERLTGEHPDLGGLDHAAIHRKIQSRMYLGEMRQVGTKGKPRTPSDVWLKAHEPIVDAVTWRRAQTALTKRRIGGRPASGASRTASFLLRGLVRCGHCGYVMTAHSPMPNRSVKHGGWYLCRRAGSETPKCEHGPAARYTELDAVIDAAMLARLKELAADLARPAAASTVPAAPDFDRRKTTLLRKRKNVVDAVANGTISQQDAKATLDDLAKAMETIERARDEYEASRRDESPAARKDELKKTRALAASWSRMTTAEKRRVIAMHADRIVVYSTATARWQRNDTWRHEVTWRAAP